MISFEILCKEKCKILTKSNWICVKHEEKKLLKRLKCILFQFAQANLKIFCKVRNFLRRYMTVRPWLLETLRTIMCLVLYCLLVNKGQFLWRLVTQNCSCWSCCYNGIFDTVAVVLSKCWGILANLGNWYNLYVSCGYRKI